MRARTIVLLAPVAALLAAGCGTSPSSRSGSATPGSATTARAVLLASVERTASQSFVADMTTAESFTVTGSGAAQFRGFGQQPTTFAIHMVAENQQRVRLTISGAVAGRSFTTVAVTYDGALYVSTDGATFKVVPTTGTTPAGFASDNALAYLQSVGSVTDEGPATADGVAVERYSAQLDSAKIVAMMKAALSSVQLPQLQSLFNNLTFSGGALQVTIDHQGRLVTENGPIDVAVDLGSFGAGMAGTRMTIHETVDAHYHDYGAAVTVSRPPVIAS
jgi:hypothetical protein